MRKVLACLFMVFLCGLASGADRTLCRATVTPEEVYLAWHANYAEMQINKMTYTEQLIRRDSNESPPPMLYMYKEVISDGSNENMTVYRDPNHSQAEVLVFNQDLVQYFIPKANILEIRVGKELFGYRINPARDCLLLRPEYNPLLARFKYAIEQRFDQAKAEHKLLLVGTEQVLGYDCYVVQFRAGRTYWFAPQLGMLMLKHKDYQYNNLTQLNTSIEVTAIKSVQTVNGEWWYPREALYYEGGMKSTKKITILDMQPEFVIPADTFNPVWPQNTRVTDTINRTNYIYGLDDISYLGLLHRGPE